MTAAATESSELSTLSKHAKSFRWAGMFLGRKELARAATLYSFCREVDDFVDETDSTAEGAEKLKACREMLAGNTPPSPSVERLLTLASETGIEPEVVEQLLIGMESDLGEVKFRSASDLVRYCYRAAGVVGVMMCCVLDVHDPKARAFALDLGIAMQLSNICRDVLEDAERGRVYLPNSMFQNGVNAEDLIEDQGQARAEAELAVTRLLQLANDHYRSSDLGLRFLPFRSRFAILVASRVYERIGTKIQEAPSRLWDGRVFVSPFEKLRITLKAGFDFLTRKRFHPFSARPCHKSSLHSPLEGLPAVTF